MGETHPAETRKSEGTADLSDNPSPQDEQVSRRIRKQFRTLLDGGSLALFFIFLARLLPSLLKFNPLDPIWQENFASQLLNDGLVAFLGFLLLHLAVFIQPQSDRLRRRLRLVRRLAVIAVAGYLLLVPLQISSTLRDLSMAQGRRNTYQAKSSRLSEIRDSVQQATTTLDMNVRLQSLQEPDLTPEQLNQPLPVLRRNLLKTYETRQAEISRLLKETNRSLDPFALFSQFGSALGWAMAFAAGAVPWGSHSTVLERVKRSSS